MKLLMEEKYVHCKDPFSFLCSQFEACWVGISEKELILSIYMHHILHHLAIKETYFLVTLHKNHQYVKKFLELNVSPILNERAKSFPSMDQVWEQKKQKGEHELEVIVKKERKRTN